MLVTASVTAQGVGLLALPILSRLYDDYAFGMFHLYAVLLNILLMVCALRYEVAILTARTNFELRSLLRLVIRLIFFIGLVCALIVIILSLLYPKGFGKISTISYLIPVMVIIGGMFVTSTYILIREREYVLSAQIKFLQSSVYAFGAILLAFWGPMAAIGLISADLLSRLISVGFVLTRLPQFFLIIKKRILWLHAKFILWKFREFPLITLPGTLSSALVGAIVPVLFATQFDLSVAGQYALVERFVLLPIGVIAGAAAQVFTGDFAKYIKEAEAQPQAQFRKVALTLMVIGAPGTLLLYYFAPWLIPVLFGAQWELAGELCRIAAPIALVNFVAGPLNMVLIICNRQKLQLSWEIFRLLITVGLFIVFVMMDIDSPLTFMRWYVASVVFSYALHLFLADRVAGHFSSSQRKKGYT